MTAPDHEADVLRAGVAGNATGALPAAAETTLDDAQRLQLFAYLQAPEHRTYLAIMRLFTSTLLADLSAGEVAAALAAAEREGRVALGESDVDTVIDRLKQLVKWGNLVVGRRETIASSIAAISPARGPSGATRPPTPQCSGLLASRTGTPSAARRSSGSTACRPSANS